MNSVRLRVLVEIALAVALAAVLNWFGVRLPFNIAGGRVSLDMLPIFVVALRRGLLPGIIAGAAWGCADLLFDPYIVHPVQVVLDYPLAFALCGFAGLGAAPVASALKRSQAGLTAALSAGFSLIGATGRFASHWLSGVVFFASSAPKGQPVGIYSAVYNLAYVAPSAIACAVLAALLVPTLDRAVPVER